MGVGLVELWALALLLAAPVLALRQLLGPPLTTQDGLLATNLPTALLFFTPSMFTLVEFRHSLSHAKLVPALELLPA